MNNATTDAVLPAAALGRVTQAQVGAKAANLGRLLAAGHRVPPFAVLTADACHRILGAVAEPIAEALTGLDHTDPLSLRAVSDTVRKLVTALTVPADIGADLSAAVAAFGPDVRLAVRSSVSGEDSASDSFAGQLDTLLNVAPAEVEHAVLECLASAYSERSLFYRAHRGLDNGAIDCAVLVQVLVDSAVAGVVFSCNPQTGDENEAVVSAGLGLGEGVVSGTVECDTYFVDVAARAVRARTVTAKRHRVESDSQGGTVVRELPEAVADSALTDAQVLELTSVAADLAELYGAPQDVEWAYDDAGVLYLLQARPVTATGDRETIFDNVNVAESYPGLSSPLTFSVLRLAYEQVFRACHRDFGATGAIVARNASSLYPYLVGTVHGRIYYNISNWYRLFLQIPGMEFAIAGWEAALNIENRYRRPAPPERGLAKLKTYLLRIRVVAIVLIGWLRLPKRLRRFFTELSAFTADLDYRLNPENPSRAREPEELLRWMERCISDLIPAYSVQIFNDFLAQQMFHLVGILLERQGLSEAQAATLRNELFCGEEGVDSVDPVRSALELAAAVREDDALRALFEGSDDAAQVWRTLAEPRFDRFRAACLRHIALFGDRTLDELKLETDPLGERPELLVPMLRNYVRGGQDIAAMEAREKLIRAEAERTAGELFREAVAPRLAFRIALRLAREHVKQRENMRLGRSRSFGLIKRLFREYGRQLHEAGVLDDPRDIFWLTYEEIAALTRGTAVDTDAARTVALRKRDHERWRAEDLPSRVVTTGIAAAHFEDPELARTGPSLPGDATGVLSGVGCAPGRVRAPALVLTEPDPTVAVDGQILVASTTDPGWVFLMVAAGGLVSEKGSVLSHTAIIGRELGIPTVVGVADATRLIADGAEVVIDGKAGTVTLAERVRSSEVEDV
ncbi:PEP/pyruvate-binding domain-containing protein [Nocardia puris]|uniref:Pyruvate,water dikinase n=1 Tax=Nocardia puris TaxID=208602 RepID=A0A366CX92_9NOCA|nr:PEP/pyruvate-binding domain-containing protein [Nocardia puris]RBO80091.1 pyruvate,water dikinase [Nocardia puris]